MTPIPYRIKTNVLLNLSLYHRFEIIPLYSAEDISTCDLCVYTGFGNMWNVFTGTTEECLKHLDNMEITMLRHRGMSIPFVS